MKVTKSDKALAGCEPVYNPQWDAYMQVDKAFTDYMEQHGFTVWHTGGGCTAWGREDNADYYTLITYEGPKSDDMIGEWAAMADDGWVVVRYHGESGAFLSVCAITLERALGIAERIRNPNEDEQEMLDPETLEVIEDSNLYGKK